MLGRREVGGVPLLWWAGLGPAALLGAAAWLPEVLGSLAVLAAYALLGLLTAVLISFARFELASPRRPVVLMLARSFGLLALTGLAVALLARLA